MKSAFAGADLGHPLVMSCSWIGRAGVEGHRSLAQTRRPMRLARNFRGGAGGRRFGGGGGGFGLAGGGDDESAMTNQNNFAGGGTNENFGSTNFSRRFGGNFTNRFASFGTNADGGYTNGFGRFGTNGFRGRFGEIGREHV